MISVNILVLTVYGSIKMDWSAILKPTVIMCLNRKAGKKDKYIVSDTWFTCDLHL